MKKLLLTIGALFAFMLCEAQVKTHSTYDVDGDGKVTVSDVTKTVNKLTGQSTGDRTVVDGESLNETLLDILAELKSLQEQVTVLKSKKCLCNCSGGESGDSDEGGETGDPDEGGDSGNQNNGHEYVDLGLSVKWATCNVGADSPEEFGKYYAWGETAAYGEAPNAYPSDFMGEENTGYTSLTVKTDYQEKTYKYSMGINNSYTRYCYNDVHGVVNDGKHVLEPIDDAASVNWGGYWRMPTYEEQKELLDNCYWVYVESYNDKDVKGYMVYKVKDARDKGGKTDNRNTHVPFASYSVSDPHIFLPIAGERSKSYLGSKGDGFVNTTEGWYWSSTVFPSGPYWAYYLYFSATGSRNGDYTRENGMTIRAVCP